MYSTWRAANLAEGEVDARTGCRASGLSKFLTVREIRVREQNDPRPWFARARE
jgi:hypothetical protein